MDIISIGNSHLTVGDYQFLFSEEKIQSIDIGDVHSIQLKDNTFVFANPKNKKEMSHIFSSIRERDWSIPIFFFMNRPDCVSSFIDCDSRSFCFNTSDSTEKIKESFHKASQFEKIVEEFIQVPIRSLSLLDTTPVDLFLRLSANKNLKIVNKNCDFLGDTLQKFIDKNCDFVYVRSEAYPELVSFMADSQKNPIWESMDGTSKALFARETFDFVHHSLHAIGLNEKTFKLTNKLLLSSSHFIKSNKNADFKKVWNSVVTGKNYLIEHSLLLAYITVGAQQHFQCKSRDKAQKLLLSSIFHDIALTTDIMAKEFGTPFQKDSYPHYIEEEFETHHKSAVALLASMSGISSDVDTILMQHHERPDGTGFPRGLAGTQIHPLSCLFIVAQDFVQRMYHRGFSLYARNEVIREMQTQYTEGFFKDSMHSLVHLFGMANFEGITQEELLVS